MATPPEPIERHYSLDIEAYATTPNAVILSVGACTLYPDLLGDNYFYSLVYAGQHNRSADPDTVAWWNNQSIPCPNTGTLSLTTVLDNLTVFLTRPETTPIIWCKGTDFDTAILSHAYKQLHKPLPWKYNSTRDMRTLIKVMPWIKKPENSIPHNALADAESQAVHIRLCLADLARLKPGEST